MPTETVTFDIDTPNGARQYIAYAATNLIPGRTMDFIKMASGERIEFAGMTDEQAVRVARALYLDIELPAAERARKQ